MSAAEIVCRIAILLGIWFRVAVFPLLVVISVAIARTNWPMLRSQGFLATAHDKYLSAPFMWQWFWIFPAANHCNDPRLNIQVRYYFLSECIQRAVQTAARKVGLDGLITAHVLRHA